jgi:hypothetical protein
MPIMAFRISCSLSEITADDVFLRTTPVDYGYSLYIESENAIAAQKLRMI